MAGGERSVESKFSGVDEYGFKRDEDFDEKAYDEFMSTYLGTLVRRGQRWDKSYANEENALKKCGKIKRFVRKGIPSGYRSNVWMAMSGAQELKNKDPNSYLKMLSQRPDQDSVIAEQINTDIPRTFPKNIYFSKDDPKSLQQPLFNVLLAFSHASPSVGYCQGLNYIVGLLLLVTKDEEKSYWLLRALTENLLPDYYIPDIPGLITDVRVFAEIVAEKAPAVYKHVEKFQIPWELICSKWFVCLYSDVLPIETVLRIWDCLFYDGSKVLLRVAITLIKIHETELLNCNEFSQLVKKFQEIATSNEALHCHDFIKTVYKVSDPMKSKELIKKRNRVGYFVKRELKKMEEKRNGK